VREGLWAGSWAFLGSKVWLGFVGGEGEGEGAYDVSL